MATIQGSCSLNPTKYSYYAEWSESNINVANNTSDVTVNVYVQKIGNYNSEGSNNSNTLYIDGTPYTTSGLYIDMNPETTPRLVASGTKTITHNSDGSKSITISCSGSLPYGNGYGPQSGSLSATVSLTTIPREAYITNSVSFTIGNNIPLTIVNSGNLYVKSELYVNNTLIKTTNHGQVTSATITPTSGEIDSMYAQVPNATSVSMYVRLKTYTTSGYSTQVGGNRDQSGTASVNQTTNKPTFTDYAVANVDKSVEVVDKYSNSLVTSSTSTLLGSDSKMIKGYSKLRATISTANKMVALNSATAVKYRFVAGAKQTEANYSADSTVTIDIDNATTKDVSVLAIDSRSLSTSVAKSLDYLADYTPISIWGLTLVRDNGVDDGTKLQISGKLWKEYFGGGTSGVLNTVTAHYRYKETTESWSAQTWNAITLTDDGSGNLSYDDYVNGDLGASGFDPEKSYNVEVRVFDKLSQMIVESTLSVGVPVMHMVKQGISLGARYDSDEGGLLQLLGKNILNIATNSVYRQAIINGNFDVWQRGTSFGIGSALFSADRWGYYTFDSTTISRQSFSVGQTDVPNNPKYYLRCSTSGQTGSGDMSVIIQKIEDVRTFAGQTVSGSFWIKADSNCYVSTEFAQGFGSGGSSAVFSIGVQKHSVTTGWNQIFFTADIPSITGKTLGDGNNLALHFWFSAGSDFNARTDSLGLQNRVIDIAQVQLNLGVIPLPFFPKSEHQELLDCYRYYYRIAYNESYGGLTSGACTINNTSLFVGHFQTPVVMRKKPVFGWSNPSHFFVGDGVNNSAPTGYQSASSHRYTGTNFAIGIEGSGWTLYRPYTMIFQANSSAYIEFNAEI